MLATPQNIILALGFGAAADVRNVEFGVAAFESAAIVAVGPFPTANNHSHYQKISQKYHPNNCYTSKYYCNAEIWCCGRCRNS